jgi:phage shock protein C
MTPDYAPQPRRLYRSRRNRVFMGVCGGIAEYFDLNPTGVRLLYCLLTSLTMGFFGLVLYIALGLTLREPPDDEEEGDNTHSGGRRGGSRGGMLREANRRFEQLDHRLQRMESIVTDPRYDMEKQFHDL